MLVNQPMVFGMRADPLCASIVMVRMVPVVMVVVAASDHVPELVMHLQANHQCPNREQGAGIQGTLVRVELGNHGDAKVGHSSTGNFQKFRKLASLQRPHSCRNFGPSWDATWADSFYFLQQAC